MGKEHVWLKVIYPRSIEKDTSKVETIANNHGGVLRGTRRGNIKQYDYNTKKKIVSPSLTMIFEFAYKDARVLHSEWQKRDAFRGKVQGFLKTYDAAFDKLYHYNVASRDIYDKPRLIWSQKERQIDKANKQSLNEENIVGRIFTQLHEQIGEVFLVLNKSRKGFYTLQVENYSGKWRLSKENFSKKELIANIVDSGKWKERDIAFLACYGSPKKIMTEAIEGFIEPYNKGLAMLEEIKEESFTEINEKVVSEALKENVK